MRRTLRLGATGATVAFAGRLICGFALDAQTACSAGSSNGVPAESGHDGAVVHLNDAGADATTNPDDATVGEDAGAVPPTDAAASDGGRDFSTDPARFLGASRCADSGLQLCEDFERGTLDKTIWSVVGAPPVVGTAEHARGSHALHVTMNSSGASAIRENKTFPEPGDTYYGRMFVKFASLPAPPGMSYAHWTIVAASGTGVSGEIRVSGQLQNGKNLFGVGTDNRTDAGTGDWTNSDKDPDGSPNAVPLSRWICLEWMHKGDTDETALWWDGVPHPSLSTTASMHGGNSNRYALPQFDSVWVGWQEYQSDDAGEPFELWIDEVAIDPNRIGCAL